MAAGVLLAAATVQCAPAEGHTKGSAHPRDVVTWAAGAQRLDEGVAGRGYRLVVRTSVGGTAPRIRLSNAHGDRPVTFDGVYAGLRERGAALVRGTNRRLTFDGEPSVTVPAGGAALSDPARLTVPASADLVVSFRSADAAGPATGHWLAMQTSYVTHGGHTAEESGARWRRTTGSWFHLDAVSVRPARRTGAVAVLGDSLTDGWRSTTDANRRWPDLLAERLRRAGSEVRGVANAGIAGGKVLSDGAGPSALNRLGSDALGRPGVRTVFLFAGINDIKYRPGVTAPELIAGYREIVTRAHAAGKCVVGATLAPFKGWSEWSPQAEAVRQDVNRTIRDGGLFDAVTDFDRALRDPRRPGRLRPAYDSGDHLHPNDRGMRAMADAVGLETLACRDRPDAG
ncbi:SGNH/GDSL hydrolase family protein [Streptomyces sp. DH24]|uniref:SGNH/GDSL hydrolase family protein n=1 Tax=Streptomyces sp. DH24 TaxID=3040123 RepID=UPI002442D1E6|nr:SGNH/GDSL hydrolase family protein [Streptomyces sp. DH24]MDG9717946.1 SGNH/GDSL hydrolase family protein [Streptomyces sp. DH24]